MHIRGPIPGQVNGEQHHQGDLCVWGQMISGGGVACVPMLYAFVDTIPSLNRLKQRMMCKNCVSILEALSLRCVGL